MKARRTSAILVLVGLCLFAAPAADAAPDGTYRGESDGELGVKLKVRKNRITKFESAVYATCWTGNHIAKFSYPAVGLKGKSLKIKGNGTFKVVFQGSFDVSFNDDKRTLKGKFKGRKVAGSMKVEGLCSADASFSARK